MPSFAQRPRKRCVRFVTQDGTICAKNIAFGYHDGTNRITGKGIQLRSPTPIMASGLNINLRFSLYLLNFESVNYQLQIWDLAYCCASHW